MFYCNNCAQNNNWPLAIVTSHEKCEVCEKTTICNNVPAFQLPTRNKGRDEVAKAKKVLKEAGYVMHFWTKDDIRHIAKDRGLEVTEDHVGEVADLLETETDCNYGINWDTIVDWIRYVKE